LLAAGLTALSVAADDKNKKPADSKPPDWSEWLKHSVTGGEVTKADAKGFTLKVVVGREGNRPKYQEVQFLYAENGLARWKKLPPKTDEKGKRTPYTSDEMKAIQSPRGAPGYAAEREDIKPGYVLEVTLVRPKEVPASKVVYQDLRVQYAVVLTQDPNAVAAIGKREEKKTDDKKKDEKKKDDKKSDDKKKDEKKEEK
jgi:hypothetical protein